MDGGPGDDHPAFERGRLVHAAAAAVAGPVGDDGQAPGGEREEAMARASWKSRWPVWTCQGPGPLHTSRIRAVGLSPDTHAWALAPASVLGSGRSSRASRSGFTVASTPFQPVTRMSWSFSFAGPWSAAVQRDADPRSRAASPRGSSRADRASNARASLRAWPPGPRAGEEEPRRRVLPLAHLGHDPRHRRRPPRPRRPRAGAPSRGRAARGHAARRSIAAASAARILAAIAARRGLIQRPPRGRERLVGARRGGIHRCGGRGGRRLHRRRARGRRSRHGRRRRRTRKRDHRLGRGRRGRATEQDRAGDDRGPGRRDPHGRAG